MMPARFDCLCYSFVYCRLKQTFRQQRWVVVPEAALTRFYLGAVPFVLGRIDALAGRQGNDGRHANRDDDQAMIGGFEAV